jgi:hypothetical protein
VRSIFAPFWSAATLADNPDLVYSHAFEVHLWLSRAAYYGIVLLQVIPRAGEQLTYGFEHWFRITKLYL